MDSKRFILYAALAFVCYLLWQAWEKDYGTPAPAPVATQPASLTGNVPVLPTTSTTSSAAAPANVPGAVPASSSVKAKSTPIRVTTDVLNVTINPEGGDIVYAALPKYPADIHTPNTPFVLLDDKYMAQSRLFGNGGPDSEASGAVVYQSEKTNYALNNDNDLRVDLTWKNGGLSVVKSFLFKRGSYSVQVSYTINNQTAAAWNGRMYTQLQQDEADHSQGGGMLGLRTYVGAALSTTDQHFEKIKFTDMAKQDLSRKSQGGWVAMLQHYFLSAWVPNATQQNEYYTRVYEGKHYVIGGASPLITVAPRTSATTAATLYIGPELPAELKKIAPYLDLTIDYGILWPISELIFWIMSHLYGILGNWGFAIIFVTLIIKLAFYRLSASSYKSMARMRQMQPRIEQLKERYGSDRQKMGQAMMELYKKEKINPLGGCLPILVQIPFFIALYWVLIESVELRQAPFILWIQDLSVKDPYWVLPLLMGGTMFIQQKLSPAPPDPTQARVMMMMPIVFTVLFLNFPAGLVLYWLVNNSLSILQQWWITKQLAPPK